MNAKKRMSLTLKLKEKLTSKRGSVLFIVLVIMSFMVMLSSAVYYTVMNGRKTVVMEYSDYQAAQSANDVLSGMENLIMAGGDNAKAGITGDALYTAIFGDGNTIPGIDTMEARQKWATAPQNATARELVASGAFVEGEHYISTTSSTRLSGGGDASIIIFANRYGDIVIEATVDYNGKSITTSRIYDKQEVMSINPKWANTKGGTKHSMHWKWENDPTVFTKGAKGSEVLDPDKTSTFSMPQPGPSWKRVLSNSEVSPVLGSGHFLYNKKWVKGSRYAWATRQGDVPGENGAGTCGTSDPDCTGSACKKAGASGTTCFNNRCDVSWDACYQGNGWWAWIKDDSPPRNANGISTDISAAWKGVKWVDSTYSASLDTGNWYLGKIPCATCGEISELVGHKSEECSNADEDEDYDSTSPIGKNPDGTFTFSPPGVDFEWKQRAAFHATGAKDDLITHIANRGLNSSTYYDTRWTVFGTANNRSAYIRGNITARGNLVIGCPTIDAEFFSAKNPLEITAGGDCHVGGYMREHLVEGGLSKATEDPGQTILKNGNNFAGGKIDGHVVVRIDGDMYTYQNQDNFVSENTIWYVAGDLYICGDNYPSKGKIYVAGRVEALGQNAKNATVPNNIKFTTPDDDEMEDVGQYALANKTTGGLASAIRAQIWGENEDGSVPRGVGGGLAARVGKVDSGLDWPAKAPPADRRMTIGWGNQTDDDWNWEGATRPADNKEEYTDENNPLSKYGIVVNNEIKDRIFYIDKDTTLINGGKNSTQNGPYMVIVDTGLGDNAKTINIKLEPHSGDVFNFKNNLGSDTNTTSVAIMAIGDGTVVYDATGTKYLTTQSLYVGPFNLAVQSDTSKTDWINCERLKAFTGNELQAHQNWHNSCSGSCSGRCTWGCWLNGLVENNGSGIIRSTIPETEIPSRNQESALNLNVYIVSNDEGADRVVLQERSLFAGTLYLPRMKFSYEAGAGDRVGMFGSIIASEITTDTMQHLIAVLPGGGRGTSTKTEPPFEGRGRNNDDDGEPEDNDLKPVDGEGDPNRRR